jgi:transposase-like protein
MKVISQATKETIVKKALSQPDVQLKIIAKRNNIGYSSLTKWLKQYRNGQFNQLTKHRNVKKTIPRSERLQHLLSTASLDERATGVYCRERGIYALQLTEWKNEIMTENDEEKYKTLLNELKALRLENKELKQNLNRKDRALAETTALLVLKKKADAILGDLEVD